MYLPRDWHWVFKACQWLLAELKLGHSVDGGPGMLGVVVVPEGLSSSASIAVSVSPVFCLVGPFSTRLVTKSLRLCPSSCWRLSALFILPSISLLCSQVILWRLTTRWSSTSGMQRRPVTQFGSPQLPQHYLGTFVANNLCKVPMHKIASSLQCLGVSHDVFLIAIVWKIHRVVTLSP